MVGKGSKFCKVVELGRKSKGDRKEEDSTGITELLGRYMRSS